MSLLFFFYPKNLDPTVKGLLQWHFFRCFGSVLQRIGNKVNRHHEVKSDSSGCSVSVFAFLSEQKQHRNLRLLILDLSNFRGQKLNTVIIFWISGCRFDCIPTHSRYLVSSQMMLRQCLQYRHLHFLLVWRAGGLSTKINTRDNMISVKFTFFNALLWGTYLYLFNKTILLHLTKEADVPKW